MKMKKYILSIAFLTATVAVNAQVLSNKIITSDIPGSNVILDGSTQFATEVTGEDNLGKGIIIPSVDLTSFEFTDVTNGLADGVTFPTFYDGMLVYNRATGTTQTTGQRSSTATAVTPGFYYFYNPDGATNQTVTSGVWKPLGGSGSSATASNGLTAANSEIKLGGALTDTTTITLGEKVLLFPSTTGKVIIGSDAATTSVRLEVNGASANSSAYNAESGTSIDFSKSNLAYTAASSSDFVLQNMKDGGAYTLAIQGTTGVTATFTTNNGITSKVLNNRPTSGDALYTIIVMGTTAYIYVATGFN
jgi:hypothetical protein